MLYANKLNKKTKRLSLEIASLSAYRDGKGEWWGNRPAPLGDLQHDIQKLLTKFADWQDKERMKDKRC